MTFTSPIFLFGLLPWFLIAVWLAKKNNIVSQILLFAANTVFYIWGGAGCFFFACAYVVVIWLFSCLLSRSRNRLVLGAAVFTAILPLAVVKYSTFAVTNLNMITGWSLNSPVWIVPTGISFFTFEAVSLLTDFYTGRFQSRPSLKDTFLYLTFFPTVVSGPILRFPDFQADLKGRGEYTEAGSAGERIIFGLCKKVLIADKLAPLVQYYFDGVAAGNAFSTAGLWLGSIAFSLQLYFDFSGYSDMAIGIGALLGFKICENFHDPYCASGISDFWRRWHISLSQWFRDYVYIPLGGNRCSKSRHVFNLLAVWMLTGIWHGADWSFILWGLGYFVLLCAEKYIPAIQKLGKKWYGHLYTLFFVNLLWVLFRADSLPIAGRYLAGMFRFSGPFMPEEKAVRFIPYILLAILLCFPRRKTLNVPDGRTFQTVRGCAVILLAFLAACAVINTTYMPYIYGNF